MFSNAEVNSDNLSKLHEDLSQTFKVGRHTPSDSKTASILIASPARLWSFISFRALEHTDFIAFTILSNCVSVFGKSFNANGFRFFKQNLRRLFVKVVFNHCFFNSFSGYVYKSGNNLFRLSDGSDADENDKGGKQKKYYVADVEVSVVSERVQYYSKDGVLTTESLKDFTRQNVKKNFASLDEFLRTWTSAEKKETIVEEWEKSGVLFEALEQEVGKDFDAFDLVCHIAYGQKPLTRRERAENVKKRNYFAKYEGAARSRSGNASRQIRRRGFYRCCYSSTATASLCKKLKFIK